MANAPVDVYEPGMLCRVRERRQALQGGGKCCQNWHRKEGYEGKQGFKGSRRKRRRRGWGEKGEGSAARNNRRRRGF